MTYRDLSIDLENENSVIDHAELLRILSYDADAGTFTWRVCLSNRAPKGSPAGRPTKGRYANIAIQGQVYLAHKLAIYYYSGIYPVEDVDHRDGNPANNRVRNLRAAGPTINAQNRRRPSRNSKSGLLGVCKDPITGRWRSQILALGVKHHLGRFDTPEAASNAYLNAKRELHAGNTL